MYKSFYYALRIWVDDILPKGTFRCRLAEFHGARPHPNLCNAIGNYVIKYKVRKTGSHGK